MLLFFPNWTTSIFQVELALPFLLVKKYIIFTIFWQKNALCNTCNSNHSSLFPNDASSNDASSQIVDTCGESQTCARFCEVAVYISLQLELQPRALNHHLYTCIHRRPGYVSVCLICLDAQPLSRYALNILWEASFTYTG